MTRLANAQIWVHDQDEALAFYTEKLGWEVRSDVSVPEWSFRWLVVGPVGQAEMGVVLMGYQMAPWDDEMKALIAEVTAKGGGTTLFLETEDCQASYEALLAKGADVVALGRIALANPDWPRRVHDPAWEPRRPPHAEDELVANGLSPKFATYMRSWKGFVEG